MISVQEVITDPDMTAPQPYQILRSTGSYIAGGFQSITTTIQCFGPVQQASNHEIQMLPEADRVGSISAFWSTQPIYTTRGTAAVPSVQGAVPAGDVPGTVYSLPTVPSGGVVDLYLNGLRLTPRTDYVLNGLTIALVSPTASGAKLWAQWNITANVQAAASDLLVYEDTQFRVLQVYHDVGCGYWKALGTRMAAA